MFDLKLLGEIYRKNENLIEYMRSQSKTEANTAEQIMISYDFQAGTYTKDFYQAPESRIQTAKWIADIISAKKISGSIMEAGVGEATIPYMGLIFPGPESRQPKSLPRRTDNIRLICLQGTC